MVVTRHDYVVSGWGTGEVWADDGVLLVHELTVSAGREPRRRAAAQGSAIAADPTPKTSSPHGGARAPTNTLAAQPSRERDGFVSDLCRRFAAHLAGEPAAYDDVALDDGWCTPFQRELLGVLRSVPWGEIVSYGELAVLAGRPGAARAAGSFCAANRFALVVPCHRVVGATGIGGYGASGIGVKRRLLELEGVLL